MKLVWHSMDHSWPVPRVITFCETASSVTGWSTRRINSTRTCFLFVFHRFLAIYRPRENLPLSEETLCLLADLTIAALCCFVSFHRSASPLHPISCLSRNPTSRRRPPPPPIIERLDNSVLLCLADVLPRSDLKNLVATCQKLYLVLIRQLYVDDIRSGHRQALSWACDAGVLSTVERCLELGAPIDDTFRDGHDYYHVHAVGHASWLHYVDNYRDCSQARGLSPLIVAVASGQVEVVRYLLKSGADPNKSSVAMERGEPPESPLQWAVLGLARQCDKPKCHRYEVLKALLEAGADPNARDYGQGDELWAFRWDETEPAVHAYPYPLHLAMEATFKNEECPPQAVDLLLRHGAQALAKGNPRDAPPGSAAWSQALLWHLKEYASVGGYWQKGHVYRESAYTFAEKLRLVLERFPGALVPDDWVELLAILAGRPRFHTVLMLKAALDHGYDPNARLRRHRDPAEDGAIRIVLWALRHSAKTIERFFPYLEVMDCAIDMLRILLAAGGEARKTTPHRSAP